MAGQLFKIPVLIERLCRVADTVEDDGDESEGAAGFGTLAQGLSQEQPTQSLALVRGAYSQPRQHGDGEHSTRQTPGGFGRQVAEIHLSRGQRVVPAYRSSGVEQDLGDREVFFLVLKPFRREPVVHRWLPALKRPA